MKFLIYQYYYPDPTQDTAMKISKDNTYYEMSRKSIKKYSEILGADYRYLTDKHPVSPFYGIFLPFTEGWCHDYDAICWMDSDILATNKADNVFNFYDKDSISAYHMDTGTNWIEDGHFNSGVVIWPKSAYGFVTEYVKNLKALHIRKGIFEKSLGDFDQAIVNKIIKDWGKYKKLPESMNYHLHRKELSKRFNNGLIHYWRHFKSNMNLDFKNGRILK